MLYVGEEPRGNNGAYSTLCRISVTPSTTHNQIGPSWCCFPSGWAVDDLVGLSNELSCEAESPAATPTPMGVFNQRFEALFPRAGALGCAVCFSPPPFFLVYLCVNVGLRGLLAAAWPAQFHNPPPRWVHQLLPCRTSSPPWLPVSAPLTGLDEFFSFISLVVGLPTTVRFSVSSACFLFLNCCRPSFGCARRHSLSTYISILSKSLI